MAVKEAIQKSFSSGNSSTIQDIHLPGLSKTKLIFKEFPGPEGHSVADWGIVGSV